MAILLTYNYLQNPVSVMLRLRNEYTTPTKCSCSVFCHCFPLSSTLVPLSTSHRRAAKPQFVDFQPWYAWIVQLYSLSSMPQTLTGETWRTYFCFASRGWDKGLPVLLLLKNIYYFCYFSRISVTSQEYMRHLGGMSHRLSGVWGEGNDGATFPGTQRASILEMSIQWKKI